jgi:hypothetical protein
MAHERLGCAQGLDEMADAEFLAGQELDDLPAERVGQGPEHLEHWEI